MENALIPVAIFAFVFVALVVAGFRALAIIEEAKAAKLAERRPVITHYRGPTYSRRDDY